MAAVEVGGEYVEWCAAVTAGYELMAAVACAGYTYAGSACGIP